MAGPAAGGAIDPVGHGAAGRLLAAAQQRGLWIATAESLTGGMLASRLIDVPGASACMAGGACTYSFEAKHRVLGLDLADLEEHGAVRGSVARAMALAARRLYDCDIAIATTGAAGPGPDDYGVPAGTAFIAVSAGEELVVKEVRADGDRPAVRAAVAQRALDLALRVVEM
ncbi:CinA family protein [Helcobacillus sp. ACRRO]|uniref:CinA family protein n=1 Tax=Helcobacillus sp. ACRRO TaxID=2918202 RepID=UPI001EF6D992|nr:CinA family protein [Helcobacillus sp. ACRRO]MCG7427567.1 CinA family protein [Helcobacillus sp. ACRRO]